MKKAFALILSLALVLMSVSALADLVICQNKVEITNALTDFAKL
jgi:PhoPQ-activated pathogenicity-related protein